MDHTGSQRTLLEEQVGNTAPEGQKKDTEADRYKYVRVGVRPH